MATLVDLSGMGKLAPSRDRQMQRLPIIAVLALFFLLLTSTLARPLAQESVSVMHGGLSSRAELERTVSRRQLVGLGGAPPSCISKCGNCSPCKPVLVPVPPDQSMQLEYYPEVWRCKCGDKLFMP